MSLSITASTDKINVGSNAAIDDLQTLTSCAWVYMNTGAISRIWQKGYTAAHGTYHYLNFSGGSTVLEHAYSRATAYQGVAAALTNFAAWGTSKWLFVVAVTDPTTNTENKLFMGDLATPAAEPSSYTTQTAGSGAFNSDAAASLYWGNREIDATALNGNLAFGAIWNRKLTLGEILAQQWWPHVTNGCVDFHHFGFNGVGTQADWSGNGNNGTVTGCAVAAHVPVRSLFGRSTLGPTPRILMATPVGLFDREAKLAALMDDAGFA